MTFPHQLDVIGFDADDTLWHNETLYHAAQEQFKQLLASFKPPEAVAECLYQTEMRNLKYYGYGIKSFTLSMIETAIELTGGRTLPVKSKRSWRSPAGCSNPRSSFSQAGNGA